MTPIKADTHFHSRFSAGSKLSMEFLIEQGRKPDTRLLVCTDHGSLRAWTRFKKELPHVLAIPAVEVEAKEGDFLVYTADVKYLAELFPFHGSVGSLRRDAETAVVWAHPCVSQRMDLSRRHRGPDQEGGGLDDEILDLVMTHIDGLELYNGTMLSLAACGLVRPLYFKNLSYLARRYQRACTGGSDAHEDDIWFKVWTEFEDPVESVADFIRAIKVCGTKPGYDKAYFKNQV